MGGVKDLMQRDEDKRGIALSIAIEAGVLQLCPGHDVPIDRGADRQPAYMLANRLITDGDPRVALFNGERRQLTDLIKAVCDNTGTTCYACDKNMAD